MNPAHVAVAQLGPYSFLVAGLAVPGLDAGLPADEACAFADIGGGLARRVCRGLEAQLVLRLAVRAEGSTPVLLVTRLATRRDEEAAVAAIVEEAARLLRRWQAQALDREALDRELTLAADWEVARIVKAAANWRADAAEVPLVQSLLAELGPWYPMLGATEFLLDIALAPLPRADLENDLRRAAATSQIMARHATSQRVALEENASAANLAMQQAAFVGSALTLTCRQAIALSADLRPFRHAFRSELGGRLDWEVRAQQMPAEELAFAVLDYSGACADLAALEAEPRRAFETLAALTRAVGYRQRPAQDRFALLLARLEVLEQNLGNKVEDLRQTIIVARTDVAAALSKARLLLERTVQYHYLKHFPHKKNSVPPLVNMIEELGDKGKVPAEERSLMHTVRVFCNRRGAHVGDPATVSDLGVVLEALCRFMEWHLSSEKPTEGSP